MKSSYTIAKPRPGALRILGLQLHPVSVENVHAFIEEVIRRREKALVMNLNIHAVNLALKRPWMRKILNQAQLVMCDSDGVRRGVRWLGMNPPPKITFDRWIWQLADFAAQRGFRLYFLGANPGVAEEASSRLKEKNPRLQVVGTRHGYFEKKGPENERVVSEINRVKPDILIVGFGMPQQEEWLSENWERLDAHILMPAGAVFDYTSGRAKRAPEWMIRCHLEWSYRLSQEPLRLFVRYVFGNPYFFLRIFLEKCKR